MRTVIKIKLPKRYVWKPSIPTLFELQGLSISQDKKHVIAIPEDIENLSHHLQTWIPVTELKASLYNGDYTII